MGKKYFTYLGGTWPGIDDRGLGIAVDSDGNACMTGLTESSRLIAVFCGWP